MKWKKISSKEIFSHPRMTLIEDTVLLPDGRETEYLTIDQKDGNVIICQNKDGKILVQKELSYPYNEVIFQFPGGKINAGEDVEVSVNRELSEEAGFFANKLVRLGKFLLNNRRTAAFLHIYLATDLKEQKLAGDLDEKLDHVWFEEQEIDNLIAEGKIIHGDMLASWSLYKSKQLKQDLNNI